MSIHKEIGTELKRKGIDYKDAATFLGTSAQNFGQRMKSDSLKVEDILKLIKKYELNNVFDNYLKNLIPMEEPRLVNEPSGSYNLDTEFLKSKVQVSLKEIELKIQTMTIEFEDLKREIKGLNKF